MLMQTPIDQYRVKYSYLKSKSMIKSQVLVVSDRGGHNIVNGTV